MLATITLSVAFAVPAHALGPDEDPISGFAHLQEQRVEVQSQLEAGSAELSTAADGSFTIEQPSAAEVPAGAASRGAARLPQLAASQFDAATGRIAFTWPGVGNVFVVPVDRRTPRTIFRDGSVVSATRVDNNLSEVTLASHEYLEQHLVVDEQHAAVKVITWRYRLELPQGVTADPTATGVVLMHGGLPLMNVVADVAVDQAGAEFPVTTAWDAELGELTVTFDGPAHASTGAVAIDPVFKDASEDQLFVMHVCQAASQNQAACEVVPGGGTPARFRTIGIPETDSKWVAGRTAEMGLFVRAKVGQAIAAGDSAALAYRTLPDTKIVGAALHATVEPATGEIGCRTELLNIDADDNLTTVDESGWGTYAQALGRVLISTFDVSDSGARSGFYDAGAEFAAMRAANVSSAAFTAQSGTLAQCSLRNYDPVAPDGQGDLFSVFMKDATAPSIIAPLAPASTVGNQLQPVPHVERTAAGGYRITPDKVVDFPEQRWYRAGVEVRHVIEASDKGSGIDHVQVSPINTPFPAGKVTLGAERTIQVCDLNAGRYSTPCPLGPEPFSKPEVLGGALNQGPNSVWYRVTDFVENRQDTVDLTFLFDSLPPTAPAASFGTTTPPADGPLIAELPTYDVDGPLILTWAAAVDPGADVAPIPTGSGIEEYTVRVFRKEGAGYVPAADNYETTTTPVAGSAMPPQNIDVAGREGIYKVELFAKDRAGNVGDVATRYFRVDRHDPLVILDAPAGEDSVEVRSANLAAGAIAARVVDPSIGGAQEQAQAIAALAEPGNNDIVDKVTLERRVGESGWTDVVATIGQRWSTTGANVTFAPFSPSSLPNSVGEGYHKLRVAAHDGNRADGTFRHTGVSGPFDLCVDRVLHGQGAYIPTAVTAVPITYAGSDYNGARIKFTVPGIALNGVVYKWIVEAEVNGEWVTVASPLQAGLTVDYTIDDWSARAPGTRYRVSAATQKCTRTGDPTIAQLGTLGSDTPIILAQPERMMPLLGLESRWSFWSMPLGGGTDAHVNTATGNVVVNRPLLQEPGIGLWTNVQLTYNSQQLGDDESLATNGVAGAHMTLAVGPGGSSADSDASSGMRISDAAVVMRDADGTVRVFEPIGSPSSPSWSGRYRATDGARLALRNISVAGASGDDHAAGVAGTVFKLTRPDGLTYYYASDRSVNNVAQSQLGRLLAVRDREGRALTYHYECVAVMPKDADVIRSYRVHRAADGSWSQVSESQGAQIVASCPGSIFAVAGANHAADLRMRLVAVRDDRYSQDGGREVRLSYHGPDSEAAGHVRMIRGHVSGGSARVVELGYEVVGAERTVRLTAVTHIGRSGDSRSVSLGYDAAMSDPGRWFDKNVMLGTVTDQLGRASRFGYEVPDADAGRLFANPRAARVENRMDVLRGDRRGVTFDYFLEPGDIGNGAQALRLGGQTTLRDQLDRQTRYNWDATAPRHHSYGRTKSVVESGGLTTLLEWNQNSESIGSTTTMPRVDNEPVQVPSAGSTRVLTMPIDVASVVIRLGSGQVVTGQYAVEASGVISPRPGAARGITIYVTYEPAASRRVEESTSRDQDSGLPEAITGDKRWSLALGNRARSSYVGAGSGQPTTRLTFSPSAVPVAARTIVRDLTKVISPRGGDSYTDIDVDAVTGRVLRVDAPGGSGSRSVRTMSYYPSGLVRASTDALGWTVAYGNYTADGEPQLVSRRFCTTPPAPVSNGCGAPLAGWASATSEAAVASIVPRAFTISYDEDAAITCIRDVRGDDSQDEARFVGFRYDDFGNVVTETSPWRRDDTDVRIRRATTHRYDANGNLLASERDRVYRLPPISSPGECFGVDGLSAGTRVSSNPALPDTEYDALDRVVLTRSTSNNIDGAKRRSRIEYDLVGNVTRQTEPNHEEGVGGFDYTTTTAYDSRDRPFMVTDGEQRRTCTYYDAYDNPVAVTPARWQGRAECSTAPDLTRSTFATFDNSGGVVSTRAISGKVSFTLTDDEGNPVRSEDLGGEREGRKEALQSDLRVINRNFDAAGNLIREQLPPRHACVAGGITGCSNTDVQTPETTNAYDALNRLIATRSARQNRESSLSGTSSTRFEYDADGRKVREVLAGGSEADRIARTEYDPFGNVVATTLPNSAGASVQQRFETTFRYADDDSLLIKDDRPHDVVTTWGYDRRGLMVSRTDQGSGPVADQWDATHRFTYWDDGSLRTGPITIAPFAANRVYPDGTCLRQPGSSATSPQWVYLVLGDQQISPAGGAPQWDADDWDVGEVRRTGRIRLRKLAFGEGIVRTYDHNGQLDAVRGCGRSIEWTRRDGVGAPLRIRNQDGGETSYRYGNGGELIDQAYPDGRSRTVRYVVPDVNPFTVDPGAGLEEIVAFDRPNLRRRYLQTSYIYTLDGAIDVEGRARSGTYNVARNGSIDAIEADGFTTYEYDHVGALTQTRVTSGTRTLPGPAAPASANPSKPGKPTKPGKAKPADTPRRRVQLARELAQEDVIRDLAGNPRRVTTTVLRARVRGANATRTQTRLYTYDVLDRLTADDLSALPARTYRYDGFGRMDRVLVEGQTLEDSTYADATRGSMLLRSKVVGLTPATRQLTKLDYGNGRRDDIGETIAGPRGQLVRSVTYDGATDSTGLDEVIRYGFTSLNEQAYATERTLEPLRARQAKKNKARRTTDMVSSYMNYDLLGRRVSTSDHEDDLTDALRVKRTATLSLYTGAEQDPYAESTSDPQQPASRWILRHQGRLVGEVRRHSSRYVVGNHQGSTLMTLTGTGADVAATFDHDTWGEPLTGPITLASGTDSEQRHNIYGYTGMRQANAGNTTHHHARDYRSDLKSWLQTDQYMDPYADLGLSLSPHTRDRHSYAWNNPVANTDPDGHDCSSGSGVSGGAACAEALNNYCDRHPSDPRCGSGPVKAEHVEQNDRQVNQAAGQSTSYVTEESDRTVAASTVISTKPLQIASLAFTDTLLGVQGRQVPYGCVSAGADAGCRVVIGGDSVDTLADGASTPFTRRTRINSWTNNASEAFGQACGAGRAGCRAASYLAFGGAFSDIDLLLERRNHHGIYKQAARSGGCVAYGRGGRNYNLSNADLVYPHDEGYGRLCE